MKGGTIGKWERPGCDRSRMDEIFGINWESGTGENIRKPYPYKTRICLNQRIGWGYTPPFAQQTLKADGCKEKERERGERERERELKKSVEDSTRRGCGMEGKDIVTGMIKERVWK